MTEATRITGNIPALLKYVDRREFIGGSDARTIMGDDQAALERLWREKRGEVEPEALSGNLIVEFGAVTEPLNRYWFAQFRPRLSAFTGLPKTYA